MAMEINPDTIFDFTKRLVELGGIYKINDDLSITNTVSDNVIAIPSGKKSIPLKVFKDGMESGEFALLMPYKEQLGINREREWFFDSLQIIIGNLIKELTLKIIKDAVEKKDDNYSQYALMNKIAGLADETMLKEVEKLRAHDFIFINYNKKLKTASAQTRIVDEELLEEHGRFRKKSWEVIQTLFNEFIGTTDPEELYTYQSTILSIPETDAKLHVIIALAKALGAYVRDILEIDLGEDILEQHLANLEGYGKLHAWVSATTSSTTETCSRPWDTTPSFSSSQPVTASSMAGFGAPAFSPGANVGPVFGQPQFGGQSQFGQPAGPISASSIATGWNSNPFGNGTGNSFGGGGGRFTF